MASAVDWTSPFGQQRYQIKSTGGLTRVDEQTTVERLSRTCEFGEDHGTVPFLLRRNVLVRDQVHTIPRGSDQTGIGQSIHGRQFLEGNRLVHVVDRHELDGSESSVDSTDQLVDTGTQVLVLFDVLSGWDGELNQYDLNVSTISVVWLITHLADPFWVLSQEDLERV